MGSRVEVEKWGKYFVARDAGLGVERAASRAGLSVSSAYRFERGDPGSGGLEAAATLGVVSVGGRLVEAPLSPEALRALEDFSYFRRRYLGRVSTPWQERAAYELLRVLEGAKEGRSREFVVMNEPPGSGKSTLFTHDIPLWLVCRDRTIRIQVGSRTERQARMYVARLKRSLEREVALRASADDLAMGVAFDAEACVQDDFGGFKPEGRSDIWRAEALVVRQLDGVSLDDKEQTVSAWGQDSGFLGGRYDLVIWDDLVDRKNMKTDEARQQIREWWDGEAESRLEPGGVLLLQGQRIQHNDLYRYCLDKKRPDGSPKYRHVVYKSHYEDRCTSEHEGLEPWPKSCLLDPSRLPYDHLEVLKHNNPRSFAVMYQQEEGDIVGGLVDPAWIQGGIDEEGYPAPGCLDKERGLLEVPPHLMGGRGWSFVTVDPSPTNFWGVIWWVFDPDSENRYIIDLHRRRMNPEQFLSLDLDTMEFSGLVVDLYERSLESDVPITHIVVEVNAAQRWLLNQPHVQRWSAMTGVAFVPHTTSINKQDPKYGLESIGDLFRQGRIRMPWSDITSRNRSTFLIDEALKYPEADTTDLLMSTWFGKLATENLYTPRKSGMYRLSRPSWLGHSQRGIA
jgi:hypothetical protein